MAEDNSGPAFPNCIAIGPAGDVYPGEYGMTLRDWFAGKALAGMSARQEAVEAAASKAHADGDTSSDGVLVVLATWSYDMADAMLIARSK